MILQMAWRSWAVCQEFPVHIARPRELLMTRYFFDVTAKTSIEHDYVGRYLPSFDHAQQMAELIGMDLGCTRVDGSFGIEVQIRTAAGALLASVPFKPIYPLSA